MEKGTAELIVKIYAVLAWVGAFFCVLAGIAIIIGGGILSSLDAAFGTGVMDGIFGALEAGLSIFMLVFAVFEFSVRVVGIFMLVFAVFEFFVGIGLWKHQNWARITEIVLNWISIVFTCLWVVLISFMFTVGPMETTTVPVLPFYIMMAFFFLLGLCFNGLILWLLQFEPTTKSLFLKKDANRRKR